MVADTSILRAKRERANNSWNWTWSRTSTVLSLLLVLELFLLFSDFSFFTRSRDIPLGDPVAELMAQTEAVRTQDPGDLVWQETDVGQSLYSAQQLMTLDDSSAEIAFLDGFGVVLGENTLIQIERRRVGDGPLVVTLLRGTIHSRPRDLKPNESTLPSTTAIEVHVPNAQILLPASAELTIKNDPTIGSESTSEVVVRSGEIEVVGTGGKKEVHGGQRVVIDESTRRSAPKVQDIGFRLRSPASGERLSKNQVQFSWDSDKRKKSSETRVEISSDPDFKRIDLTARTHTNSHSAKLPASATDATWYWRVRDSKSSSDTGFFIISGTKQPALIYPEPGARLQPGRPYEFAWNSPETDHRGYELELIRDPDGKRAIQSFKTTEPFYRTEGLPEGFYHWRVRTVVSESEASPWSERRELRIMENAPPPPIELLEPEFEPVAPKPGDESSWLDWLIPSAHADESDPVFHIKLRWKPVKEAVRYKIQISRVSSFRNLITEAETKDSSWTWEYHPGMENTKGRVFYRVASVDEHGQVGKFTDATPLPIPATVTKRREPTQRETGVSRSSGRFPGKTKWKWNASLQSGLSSLSQSSGETDLKSVSVAPHLHERVSSQLSWTRDDHTGHAFFEVNLAKFGKGEVSRAYGQELLSTLRSRLEVLPWEKSALGSHLSLGLVLDQTFRWAKTDLQAVEHRYSLGLGPAARLIRTYSGNLRETGVRLGLPITGLISGHLGAYTSLWGEFKIFTLTSNRWIGLRAEAQGSYLRFKTPSGTSVFSWGAWLGPSFHSGG